MNDTKKSYLPKYLKKRYEDIVTEYLHAFEKKQDMTLEFWVSDDIGGVACFGDIYYFDFNNIREDVDCDVPKHLILDWIIDTVDESHQADKENREAKYINYHSYRTGLRYENLNKSINT